MQLSRDTTTSVPYAEETKSSVQKVELELTAALSQIAEVESVYKYQQGDYTSILTILSSAIYQRDVHIKVYEAEYNTLRKFPHANIGVQCIPRLGMADSDFLPVGAVRIFQRDNIIQCIHKIAMHYDGTQVAKWQEWMADLTLPITKEEYETCPIESPLEYIIPLMNVPDIMYTEQSCMHQPCITFLVADDAKFRETILPDILNINSRDFIMRLKEVWFGSYGWYGFPSHWVLEPAFMPAYNPDNPYSLEWREGAAAWAVAVYKCFKALNDTSAA